MPPPRPRPAPPAEERLGEILARNGFTDPQLLELARAAARQGVEVTLEGSGALLVGAQRFAAASGPRWAV